MEFLNELSTQLGVESDKLKAAFETANLAIYKKEDFETLTNNLQKQKYEEGKVAGIEMSLKESKRKAKEVYGVETEGIKDFETLQAKVLDFQIEKIKSEYSGKSKDNEYLQKIEELEKSKSILQNELKEKTDLFESEKSELLKGFKRQNIDNELNKLIQSIPIQVPVHIEKQGKDEAMKYLAAEKKKLEILFKAEYEMDYDENNNILLKKGNEVVKDKLQNNAKLSEMLMPFAEANFFQLEKQQTSNNREHNRTFAANFKGMNEDDFDSEMQKQGIRRGSNDYDKFYKEFKDNNK